MEYNDLNPKKFHMRCRGYITFVLSAREVPGSVDNKVTTGKPFQVHSPAWQSALRKYGWIELAYNRLNEDSNLYR